MNRNLCKSNKKSEFGQDPLRRQRVSVTCRYKKVFHDFVIRCLRIHFVLREIGYPLALQYVFVDSEVTANGS